MSNYLVSIVAAAALFAGACSAADTPAAPARPAPAAAKSAGAKPVAASAAAPASYVQAPSGSTLGFRFNQAGADSRGSFKKFDTELGYDEKNLAASSLKVTVQIASLDTQEKDRDSTLAGADLFDTAKFPTATFVASSFTKSANGQVDAVGKLTLHGVTRDLRVPLNIRTTATGLDLSGETILKRLDYGIGQGDWKSTEWVGDEVKLQYQVSLVRAK